jgi:hypothetical protein
LLIIGKEKAYRLVTPAVAIVTVIIVEALLREIPEVFTGFITIPYRCFAATNLYRLLNTGLRETVKHKK